MLFAVAMLLVWQVLTVRLAVSPMLLVPPTAIWDVLAQAWPILAAQSWPTLVNAVAGFLLASVLGIALGGALVVSRRVEQAFWPHILIFQLIPKVAVAPLFIIWLGMGPSSRLCFAVFLSFFPIAVSAASGFRAADPTALRLCQSLTASTWQTFLHVRMPYAIPHIFAGLKVGVTVAIIGVVIGEFVTAQEGLGYIIMFASSAAETALVFAAITLLCVIGLALVRRGGSGGTVRAALVRRADQRRRVRVTTAPAFRRALHWRYQSGRSAEPDTPPMTWRDSAA